MVCLDTDVLVAFLRGDASAVSRLKSLEERGEPLKTTVVSACELFEGAYLSRDPQSAAKTVQNLLDRLTVLELSVETAELFGKTVSSLQKRGMKIEDFDALVASIAVANGETLVTRNVKHFGRIDGLKLASW